MRGCVVVVAALMAAPAAAQEDPRHLLRARLDSLTPLLDELSAEVEQERIAREAAARAAATDAVVLDTIRVGLLTVVTPPEHVDGARAVFAEALQGPLAKISRSPTLEGRWFTYREHGTPPVPIDRPAVPVVTDRWESRSARADRLRDQLLRMVVEDLVGGPSRRIEEPRPIALWLAAGPLGEPSEVGDPSALYRWVALTRSRSTRSCLAGDVQACIDAHGLRLATQTLEDWYEPAELVELAGQLLVPRRRIGPAEIPLIEACRTERSAAACARLLRSLYDDWAPIGVAGRLSLLWHAIEVGEPGAWSRALERADAPVVEVLETIGGRPVDQLVAGWRARLVESRTGPHVRLAPQAALALLWALAFAGLGMRSTRWRLG